MRQNYRLILAHIVPPFATRLSRVVVDVGVPGGERGNVQTRRNTHTVTTEQKRSDFIIAELDKTQPIQNRKQ